MKTGVGNVKPGVGRKALAAISILTSDPRLLDSKVFHPSSLFPHPFTLCALAIYAALAIACNPDASKSGIPPQAQAAIEAVTDDITAGRYEKIYNEAAEEWRRTTTLEQSDATFKRLKTKLGETKARTYRTAREQQTTGGDLPGHSLTVQYYTTFERGEGMETFTLVERDGHWQLAKYFVNSDALK